MPLLSATVGESYTITRIGGTPEVRKHLEDLGFAVGGKVTVISVMGDHTMPSLSGKAGVPPTDSLYWTNFIINSAVDEKIAYHHEKKYSSLDMFPTLLESMGFELEERSIGLGKSLYADKPTLLEIYGQPILDSLLRERSIQYDYFIMGQ